jgi:hypothetical protein
MSFLEKKILDNREFFEDKKIPQGHQARFLEKLNTKTEKATSFKTELLHGFMKIAAVTLIFTAVSWIIFKYSFSEISSAVIQEVINIELPAEMEGMFAQYDAKVEEKLDQIDVLAPNPEEAERIRRIARKQLDNLDAELAAIEKEFMTNPGNKKLETALINHKLLKSETIESILNRLSASAQVMQNGAKTN